MSSLLSRLLKLAVPLVLSSTTVTAMQMIDAVVVSRHSASAVAALGTASMAVILVQGLLFGTAGYCGTFAAHHLGAGDGAGVRSSAWLGIHASWISGILGLVSAFTLPELFGLVGHNPEITGLEISYTRICLAASLFPVLGASLGGWFSGVGRTKLAGAANIVGLAVNAGLAWILVLGAGPIPALGLAGAALATVASQALVAVLLLAAFARGGGLSKDAASRAWADLGRFLSTALPWGLRISGEVVAWTVFLVFLGRMGTPELAASTQAFRLNSLAFFPALGLAQAAGILAGQARGAGRDGEIPSIAGRSLLLAEGWMLACALVFLLGGPWLATALLPAGPEGAAIAGMVVVSLRFVAAYCVVDASNVVLSSVLSSLGDTRWVARVFTGGSVLFMASLWLNDHLGGGYLVAWTLAGSFVAATAVTWAFRFFGGAWKSIRLVGESGTSPARPNGDGEEIPAGGNP